MVSFLISAMAYINGAAQKHVIPTAARPCESIENNRIGPCQRVDCHRPASYTLNHPEAHLRAASHKRLSCCNCWPLKACHAFAPATCKRMSSYRCPLAFGDFDGHFLYLPIEFHCCREITRVRKPARKRSAKAVVKAFLNTCHIAKAPSA